MKLTSFIIALFLGFSLIIPAPGVYAQQISLGVSPPLVELLIKPGKSVLIAYTLQNTGDPAILTASVLPFEARDSYGNVKIKEEFEGPIQFNLDNADLQLNEPYFLRTGTSQQLLLRIRVPEGAPEGDYYYTLLNSTKPTPVTEGVSSSRAQGTIGSNIIITVSEKGITEIKPKISLFDVLTKFSFSFFGKQIKLFDSSEVIPVNLQIENTGKNIIKPQGDITLKGNFGEKATYTIVPKNILSQSQRLATATPSATIDCEGKMNTIACTSPHTLLISGFFVGKYQLSTNVHFGEATQNLYASTSFIALPFKFITIFVVSLITGFFIIRKLKDTID